MKRVFLFLYQWLVFVPLFVIATVLTAVSVVVGCALGNRRFWAYTPPRYWSKLTCRLALCKVQVRGLENINPEQSYIFTPNHQSYFDIFLIYGYLPKNIKWVQKAELRKIPLVGWASEVAGHVYIDQRNLKSHKASLAKVEQQLSQEVGASMVIFPEGARTSDGAIAKFKRGAFVVARQLALPVVPVTLQGVYEVLPRHAWCITPGRMVLTVHPPIATDGLHEEDIPQFATRVQQVVQSGYTATK